MTNWLNWINNSINEDQNDKIVKLFLKKIDEQNNNFKNEKICYNYGEKRHIINKYFKFKQKNF